MKKLILLGLMSLFLSNLAFADEIINIQESLEAYGGFASVKGREYGAFRHESLSSIKAEKQWVKDSMEGYTPLFEDENSLSYEATCLNSRGEPTRTLLLFQFEEEKENGVRVSSFLLRTRAW